MAFPLSITGRLTVRSPISTSSQAVLERLRAALSAQTVDKIMVAGDVIEFTPQFKDTQNRPRPEGDRWMLNSLGSCSLHLQNDAERVTITYKLDCRFWFGMTTTLSLGAGFIIWFCGGADHIWAWPLASFFWILFFMSGYVSKTVEFRRWLKINLTAVELPPTKRLRIPADPG